MEQSYDVLGYSSAVLATIFMALNIVVIRKCKDVHFSIVVLQLSTWSLIFSGILLYILVEFNGDKIVIPQGTNEWLLTSLVS